MLETGTSDLMSRDEKRGVASASAPALVLDSTALPRRRNCLRFNSRALDRRVHIFAVLCRFEVRDEP